MEVHPMRDRLMKTVLVVLLLLAVGSTADAGALGRIVFTPLGIAGGAYAGAYIGIYYFTKQIIEGTEFETWQEALAGSLVGLMIGITLGITVGGSAGALGGAFIGYWVGSMIDHAGSDDLESYFRREIAPHLGLSCHRARARLPLASFAL
jgi:uncharacterized protein YcfJ